MFIRILFVTVALNIVLCSAALSEQFEVDPANSGNAPFFELPCMVVGGTCARSVACPIGTKVGAKGLCPVQQDLGMECCRPPKVLMICKSNGGECRSKSNLKCPPPLEITGATDCTKNQICCVKHVK